MNLSNEQRKALRKELVELYPTIPDSKAVLEDADIPMNNIAYNSSAKLNWNAIINETEKHNMVLILINTVLEEYPKRNVLLKLKSELEVGGGTGDLDLPLPNPSQVSPKDYLNQQVSTLKRFIAVGKFDDVISKLLKISLSVSADYENSVILLSGRYHSLKKDKLQRTISSQDAQVRENQIRYALLDTIDNLKSEVEYNNNLEEFNRNVDSEISNKAIKDSLLNKKVLLQQTDTEIERVIGKSPNFVKKSWLLKALVASDAVGRIFIKSAGKFEGTGFLVKGGYLLTNEHVIRSKEDLKGSFVEFNFSDDNNSNDSIYRFNFDLDTYHSSPYKKGGVPTQNAYDYALVKVLDNGKVPLENLGFLSFETDIQPIKDDPVNIIQHPGGQIQQFSLTANEVIKKWDHYIYYKADTKKGSSGSPVLNQNWDVVALHHAGRNEKDDQGGLQIDSQGTIVPANRGILIKYIIDDLKKKGITL